MFALQAAAGFITASCSRPSVIRRVPRRESDSPPESKTITVAVSQAALPSSRLLLSEFQLFLKLVSPLRAPPHPPAASPPTLAVSWRCWPGYRCWPVVPLFEMCSPRLSLEGSGDRLISPGAHSPGKEGNIKKKKKEGRPKELAASLSTFLQRLKATLPATRRRRRSPFHEFISFGIRPEV